MHPIGQILNYEDRMECQARGTQHFRAPIHVECIPKSDEDDDEVVTKLMDKYITCSLFNTDQYPELNVVLK